MDVNQVVVRLIADDRQYTSVLNRAAGELVDFGEMTTRTMDQIADVCDKSGKSVEKIAGEIIKLKTTMDKSTAHEFTRGMNEAEQAQLRLAQATQRTNQMLQQQKMVAGIQGMVSGAGVATMEKRAEDALSFLGKLPGAEARLGPFDRTRGATAADIAEFKRLTGGFKPGLPGVGVPGGIPVTPSRWAGIGVSTMNAIGAAQRGLGAAGGFVLEKGQDFFSSMISSMGSVTGIITTVTGLSLALYGLGKAFNFVTDTVYNAAKATVTLAMQYEQARIAFEVMAGSASQGDRLLDQIQQLAIATPYLTQGLMENAKVLLGFGVNVNSVIPMLSRLGDIAAGDSDKLARLALVVGEVVSEGKITGIRLRQLSMFGVGPAELAKTLGVNVSRLRAMMHENEIDANVLISTFNRLTSAGGRFYELSAKSMTTVAGQWSNLVEAVQVGAAKLGLQIFERFQIAGRIATVADWIMKHWQQIGDFVINVLEQIGKVASDIAGYAVAAWDAFSNLLSRLGFNTQDAVKGFDSLRSVIKSVVDGLISFGQTGLNILLDFITNVAKLVELIHDLIDDAKVFVKAFSESESWTTSGKIADAFKAVFDDTRQTFRDYKKEVLKEDPFHNVVVGLQKAKTEVGKFFDDFWKGREKFEKEPFTIKAMTKEEIVSGLKKFTDMIPLEIKISAKAEKFAAQLAKITEEGITPFDKFIKQQDLLLEAFRGPPAGKFLEGILPQNVAGPMGVLGDALFQGFKGAITPAEFELGGRLNIEALQKELKEKEPKFAGAAMMGTKESMDAVAKAQDNNQTTLDRVAAAVEAAIEQRKQLLKQQADIAKALQDPKFKAILAKGKL